ncbi:peroxidasin isoform X2 [Nematostella vectensis]|nr:peroxidasin isoform X2 [Nematostella vectensis]
MEYSILSVNSRGQARKRGLFAIDTNTGAITLRRRPTAGVYRLHVQARLNDVSYSRAYVTVRVRKKKSQQRGSRFRFTKKQYSVIVPVSILKGQKILQLKIYRPRNLQNATIRYRLGTRTDYFKLDTKTGKLLIERSLRSLGNLTKVLRVRAVVRGRSSRTAEATVAISIVPQYIGNDFVESSLKGVSKDIDAREPKKGDRWRGGKGSAEFRLHRMFRQASPEARRISSADLKFSKVIERIKQNVVNRVLGNSSRPRSDVSIRLGPSSLASASKLSEIIRELNCTHRKVNCSDTRFNARYRTMDGTCNNLDNPLWGSAPVPFSRMSDPVYYDDNRLSDPVGFPDQPFAPSLPSPHFISKEFFIHSRRAKPGESGYSHMLMQWGQFLDHDITFTAESEGAQKCFLPNCDGSSEDYESPCFPIMYPNGDGCTMFTRSAAACQSDDKNVRPREQLNTVTSFIDGSQIYGSSLATMVNLRNYISKKGYLRTSSPDLLPYIKTTLKPPLNLCQIFGGCFDAGDFRVNEQVALSSMHTMWVREHNRIARQLYELNRHWDDNTIYQEARKIVGAELQHITYTEFLPKILGPDAIPQYTGYRNVNPTIMNVFATAAFRFGHSTVRPSFSRLNANFDPIGPDVPLIDAFFNNKLVQSTGIEPFLLGLLANFSQDVDRELAAGLTKHLFQQPESQHGFDLAALNIQRGRDHGLPGYGVWRRECNLTHAEIFEETRDEIRDPVTRQILDRVYNGSVEFADLWVSGLAENPVKGASVGPTFLCILRSQFRRLRDGDRFWYENNGVFGKEQLEEIKKISLSRVMCDNLPGIVSVQRDAFRAPSSSDLRVACARISGIDLTKWKDNGRPPGVPDPTVSPPSSRRWSEWSYTVRTVTGSWAVSLGSPLCPQSVVDIQCELADGSPVETSGQVVHCQPLLGVYCRNKEQRSGKCKDFRFRFACSDIPRPVPSQPSVPSIQDVPDEPSLRCSERYPTDFTIAFEATGSVTINRPYANTPHSEYLFAGKHSGEETNRFLVKFDTRKIPRSATVHSASLFLYLVDARLSAGVNQEEIPSNNLEVYQVTSTDWYSDNTTSVIPWHENYLGVGSDVDARLAVSAPLYLARRSKWISLDVAHAVRNWQFRLPDLPNYGLMIKTRKETNANAVYRIASANNRIAVARPTLIVCLTVHPW